jgi:hypothetical protein
VPEVTYIGLPALQARAIAAVTVAVDQAAEDLVGRAQDATPVDTGTLKGSIHTTGAQGGGMSVTAKVQTGGESSDYALFVHEGTGPHKITAQGGGLAFNGIVVKSVNHPGTPAFKYLERPLIEMAPVYVAYLQRAAAGAF